MKSFDATADIEASPDQVWTVLTDSGNYPNWDSGVIRVDGSMALGQTIKIVSSANPGRTFPVKVTEFQPGKRMVLSGGMPLGLFKGVRTYTLSAEGPTRTRFTMREEYTGPLLGMIWKSIPDLDPSFQQFARGLKAKSEADS